MAFVFKDASNFKLTNPSLFWCPNLDFTPNYSKTWPTKKRKKQREKNWGFSGGAAWDVTNLTDVAAKSFHGKDLGNCWCGCSVNGEGALVVWLGDFPKLMGIPKLWFLLYLGNTEGPGWWMVLYPTFFCCSAASFLKDDSSCMICWSADGIVLVGWEVPR